MAPSFQNNINNNEENKQKDMEQLRPSIPTPPNIRLRNQLIKQKYEFKDCVKEMMRVTAELEIVIEFDKPDILLKELQQLLEQRNHVRAFMLKLHTREQFIEMSENYVKSVVDICQNKHFQKLFKFYFSRFQPLIEKADQLIYIVEMEKLTKKEKEESELVNQVLDQKQVQNQEQSN